MCKKRRNKNKVNAETGMTDDEMRAAIAEAERATKVAYAAEATALSRVEDINAAKADTIQNQETAAQSTVSLDQQLAALGGSQQAIADIQQETFQEVKGATDKEKMEIRKRKEQQLQRAIRQRRKSGFQGRRSLITGQSGGRGYA
tara:strand:- start:181 stop:615 length:435 start_codon:yes stop_codon:yes gene_type:complete